LLVRWPGRPGWLRNQVPTDVAVQLKRIWLVGAGHARWGGRPEKQTEKRKTSNSGRPQGRISKVRGPGAEGEVGRLPGPPGLAEVGATAREVSQYCYFAARDRAGYRVALRVGPVTVDGRAYERGRVLFVAPHDPQFELRRDPGHWGFEALGWGRSSLG
jgi:hypothetical protein